MSIRRAVPWVISCLCCVVTIGLLLRVPVVEATETSGLLGCSDCFRDRAALLTGIENVLTMYAREQRELAEKRAFDALAAAGYLCRWRPDDAFDATSQRLDCTHVGSK